jgi:NAD(P)-dependent dehydrogenase (short-subunit alcohol dehydrogenase family)
VHDRLFDLKDKVALVTGGCSGLGRVMAETMSEAGATVYVTSGKTPVPSDLGDNIRHLGSFDLSTTAGTQSLHEAIVNESDRLQILVNNAGIYTEHSFEETTDEIWDHMLSLNLKAPYFLSQMAIGLLEKGAEPSARSRIINIASVTARFAAQVAPYSISKAALLHATRVMAAALVDRNINVNAIAPGAFRTKMTEEALDRMGEEFVNSIPMKRLGQMRDIAGAILYLASPASDFVTGHVLPVDGGYADLKC